MTKKSRCFFYTHFQEVVILEIYLDVIFLENFLMDYILLLLTGKIIQKPKKILGILFATILGSVHTMLCQILLLSAENGNHAMLQVGIQISNVVVAYIMMRCAYKDTCARHAFWGVGTMFVLSFVAGGVLAWTEQIMTGSHVERSVIVMAVGTVVFGYLFLQKWIGGLRERMFYRKCNLPVILRLSGKQIHCRGLLDSGNSLFEPITGRPVIVVEKELLRRHGIGDPERYFAIPYHAIGTQNGILKGVLADELEIPEQGEKKWQKVMLGIYDGKISRQDEYQVILHPKM